MEKEEKLIKKIKCVYTEIVKKLIDPSFKFPEGGKVDRILSDFIDQFTQQVCVGSLNTDRIADYCIFQTHKNRTQVYQKTLAQNSFGKTALKKYLTMSSKEKKYVEDKWLETADITRQGLYTIINIKGEHPLAKYIYMPSEERTKLRCINTKVGFNICRISTLLWSPLSPACQKCKFTEECKKETEINYPEIFRLRIQYGNKR